MIQPSEPNLSEHQINEQLCLLCYIVPRDPRQWDVYEHVGQWPVAHRCTHKGSPISPMLITTIPAPTPHLVTGGNFQGITKLLIIFYTHSHSMMLRRRFLLQYYLKEPTRVSESVGIIATATATASLSIIAIRKIFSRQENILRQSTKYFSNIRKILFWKTISKIFLDNRENLKNMQRLSCKISCDCCQ